MGRRPLCRMKNGYEFCYLYAALCPAIGYLVCLILPDMSKDSFCIFCTHFARQVCELLGEVPVLLIADGAGAHQQGVCEQAGFTLERLPTASPELNPVERFFEELRKDLSNQVYADITQAENHLQEVFQPYFENSNAIIELTNYNYIRS